METEFQRSGIFPPSGMHRGSWRLDNFHGRHMCIIPKNCSRITLFKIWQILHLILSPHLLGSHRSCSPILTYKVVALSIAIPFSHIFYLAFAASNNLFITRANFKDHIIKFGRLQFIERKCQPLNRWIVEKKNVNRWI